jgi:subtilisin family serine protease
MRTGSQRGNMNPLALVELPGLMQRTQGRAEIVVALIDGPVALRHPDLSHAAVREIPGKFKGDCSRSQALACSHGTFVAGILAARRGSVAPSICPECTLLLRPIFSESADGSGRMPSATPQDLAAAIIDSVDAGARVINLSVALVQTSLKADIEIQHALNYAAQRGVIAVAAAGNQAMVGSTAVTRHWWVIPVAACDHQGRPLGDSNLGCSIGRRGVSAPGENITSLGTDGKPYTMGGTSAAAPFVTGAIALLWSEYPGAGAARIRAAVTESRALTRKSIAPPVLDAWAAYQAVQAAL